MEEGAEYDALVAEIKAGLEDLVDPEDGRKAVRRVVRAQLFFQGALQDGRARFVGRL